MTTEKHEARLEDAFIERGDGKKDIFDEPTALAWLLLDETCFCNTGKFHDESTVVCFVNCSDLFAWACADGENVTCDELEPLCRAIIKDGSWGSDKWCCKKRNQQPQPPIIKAMKEAGVWCDEMEALPANTQDAEVQAVFDAIRGRE